jgi:hypothetical protein
VDDAAFELGDEMLRALEKPVKGVAADTGAKNDRRHRGSSITKQRRTGGQQTLTLLTIALGRRE